jgi:hypothetical protein
MARKIEITFEMLAALCEVNGYLRGLSNNPDIKELPSPSTLTELTRLKNDIGKALTDGQSQ